MQRILPMHFKNVSVELSVVFCWPKRTKDITMKRQKPLKNGMRFPQNPFMQKTQYANVASQYRRCEIVTEKSVHFGNAKFVQEVFCK